MQCDPTWAVCQREKPGLRMSVAGLPLGRPDGGARGLGGWVGIRGEPLAGCTRSEAEGNQSLQNDVVAGSCRLDHKI